MSQKMPSQTGNEWMLVYETPFFEEAHVIAGRLESEGIQTMVSRQTGAGAFGLEVGALGGVVVLVRPADFEMARAILAEEPEPPGLDESVDPIRYHFDASEDGADESE